MSDKSELKAELERKKQRIAQIREEKKRKEEEKKKKDGESKRGAEGGPVGSEDSDLERKRREAEALLQSVGITPDVAHAQPLRVVTEDTCLFHYLVPAPMSPSNKSVGSDAGSQDSGDGNAGPRRGAVRLAMSKLIQVDIVPKEMVSYSKETQTPTEALAHMDQKADEEEDEEISAPPLTEDTQDEKNEQSEQQEEDTPKELTEEEKLQVLHSDEFLSFFERGSRIVERALAEQVDVCFDYSGRDLEDKEGDLQAGAKLVLNRQFADERWTKNRVVTCLDWSPQYPELLVASYNNNEDAPHEPDGVALVWNMKYKKATPEYIFHCQDSLELVFKQSKAVAVTSMAFPVGDVNNFVVGSEDGSVYTACRHGRAPVLCTHSRTVLTMFMTQCGLQHILLCLLVWTYLEGWTCGTSTMTLK
ncbi:hypothetical protein XENOCAPTIV_004850 [Xenoophorus captivus]|uniref:Dynein, cytoplasmic 1, intermediate chain 2b n=1 Tax=Xenoophorus captivus TaxID=1517983 RepID=A0ABV0S9Y0_9TELE